jgi:hypothetical protein
MFIKQESLMLLEENFNFGSVGKENVLIYSLKKLSPSTNLLFISSIFVQS